MYRPIRWLKWTLIWCCVVVKRKSKVVNSINLHSVHDWMPNIRSTESINATGYFGCLIQLWLCHIVGPPAIYWLHGNQLLWNVACVIFRTFWKSRTSSGRFPNTDWNTKVGTKHTVCLYTLSIVYNLQNSKRTELLST